MTEHDNESQKKDTVKPRCHPKLLTLLLGTSDFSLKTKSNTKLRILLSIYSGALMSDVLIRNLSYFLRYKQKQCSCLILLVILLCNIINTRLWINNHYKVMNGVFYFIHCGLIYSIRIDLCSLSEKVNIILTIN